LGTGFIVHHRIVAAVKTVDFVSDRTSYICIVLRGRWCSIIVLSAHAPTEKKSDDSKDRFYEELKQILLLLFPPPQVPYENSVKRF
jgi:hypothetical protein